MSKNYCPYCMTPVPEGESCSVCGLTSGTYIPSLHHLPPGTVLMNRYLVGRVLGEGGFGITYIGCDLRLELKVAIKEYYPVDRATRNASASLEVTNFIGPSAKSFERGKQKFLGEAQVMARLDKQQVIVSVRDFFEINNTAYIVMEYIEGITFRELVEKKGGKIPAEELFPMVEPLFHALTIIHENGLIHRDISPDNLMLENGKIRLLDFGCAREASRGTETMTIALKHGYAPIEQYQQKGQGPWTDIYALSATIYYCLTGKVPPQALDRITEDELLLPSKLGIHISPEVEKALLKGMKLQPNRRFASAEEMWRAIYMQPEEKADVGNGEDTVEGIGADAAPEIAGENKDADAAENRKADAIAGRQDDSDAVQPVMEHPVSEREADIVQAGAEMEIGAAQPAAEQTDSDKKVKYIFWAGIAAVCLIMISVIWINRSVNKTADKEAANIANRDTESGNTGGGHTEVGKDAADEPLIAIDPHLFDNATIFTGGDDEDFRSLMEDDSVEAVIIDCDNIFVSRTAITKPVLLSENASWAPDCLTIAEDGYLQVEGNLDMNYSGYLRMCGNTLRVYVADSGKFWTDNAFVWMDDKACFAIAEDNENMVSQMKHSVLFSETVFEKNNVYSVTDFAALQRAIEAGGPISIDADITLEEDVTFFSSVRISDGVTVKTMQEEEGKWHHFTVDTGAVLINNGTLEGNLNVHDGGTVINNNVLGMKVGENVACASLWVTGESTVFNLGTMDVDDTSRFWENSLFVNVGELNCYDFYLAGGYMANMGNVTVEGQESRFEIQNDSRFWNKTGGMVTVKESADMCNNSWIHNMGEIVIGYGGSFENAVLMNYGIFQVQNGAEVDRDRAGIYCGGGIFDIAGANIKIYHAVSGEPEEAGRLVEVTNEQELLEALEDSEIEAVYIREDITVYTNLTLRKQLFIDTGCSLTMADDAAILDYGNVIILKESASLHGNNITLQEDAQIYMEGNSELIVDENGSMTLDSSIIWGWWPNIKLNGAAFLLKNEAGLAFDDICSLEVSNSEIILQNESVFAMPPSCGTLNINGSSVTLSEEGKHSYFYVGSDTELTDCSLCIDAGVFRNTARNMNLSNCSIIIAPDGEFSSDYSNLSLLGGTMVHNEGYFFVRGWDEFQFTVHGEIENDGTMEFAICHMDLSEPIHNQNEVYYFGEHYQNGDCDWDDAYVTGNAPIDNRVR